jgi:putative ABC transport system substrate-binding protein
VRRREFITLIGSAAAGWPLAARAQQTPMPVIGFLDSRSPEAIGDRLAAFRQGLKETDFVDGENVRMEYRWAEGHYDRLPALAADLVRREVNVIVSAAGTAGALAAKAASAKIPIVFSVGSDPVKFNLVSSLNQPGGNMTGVSLLQNALLAKQLEVLHQTVPKAGVIGILINPANPNAESDTKEAQAAAHALGLQTNLFGSGTADKIETAFADLVRQQIIALLISPDPFFSGQYSVLAALANQNAIASIADLSGFPKAGGLMSYGTSLTESYRQVGIYTGRILKGAKPADLPIVQPTKFDLVINLKTAKALGLTIPPGVLAVADEVIE